MKDDNHYLMYQKECDPVTIDLLKVRPEDIASQITLIDIPLFKAITAQELLKGGWGKKNKHLDASNIVSFTDRFNSVCLWCQREILSYEKTTKRTEVLEHFIKIAKQLYILNNLHSTFSIISALQSLSIHRLVKTWSLISRPERAVFTNLKLLFESECNWKRLREHLNSAELPCIPYIGLYLTDLSFIDAASCVVKKTYTVSLNKERKKKDIISRISYFQKSLYDNLTHIECLQKYLNSLQFHEEFIKFEEDDLFKYLNIVSELLDYMIDIIIFIIHFEDSYHFKECKVFRLSLARENGSQCASASSPAVEFLRRASLSRTMRVLNRFRSNFPSIEKITHTMTPQLPSKNHHHRAIVFGSRRARSLSAGWNTGEVNLSFPFDAESVDAEPFQDIESTESPDSNFASEKILRHTTYVVDSSSLGHTFSFTPLKTSTSLKCAPLLSPKARFRSFDNSGDQLCLIDDDDDDDTKVADYAGEVSVLTIRKKGSKLTKIKCSRKCYLELRSSQLYQFSRRPVTILSKNDRDSYNKKANKIMKLDENGWRVIHHINLPEPSFEMHHPPTGSRIYRYICKNETAALEWYKHIQAAIQDALSSVPSTLITFD
ncbi:unnamed protein product [Thelazia callipaeda]|uniref:Ras-GEF domain-containing protein n=1 Tax=Thelazia callipaeda TaxID=103827 RepID=A0A0N5D2M8_THECL|nr:unnamed protein product [Thelazia callipaeda]